MDPEMRTGQDKPTHTLMGLPDQIRKTSEVAKALQERANKLESIIVGPTVAEDGDKVRAEVCVDRGVVAESYDVLDYLTDRLCRLEKQLNNILVHCE